MEPPFQVWIIERDDGNSCPTPPEKSYSQDGYQYQLLPFPWLDVNGNGVDMEDIGALLGSGNDQVGNWTFWSYTALEGWSYNHYAGGDTEIWLNNRGFDHNQIPPGQDPYNP